MKAGSFNAITPPLDAPRMKDFLERLLKLEHKEGTAHEQQIKDLLDEFGIHYTYQPNGSQQFPDFKIPTKWFELDLEAKSSKQGYPTYNSGRPHKDGLYVFTSKRHNATTFYWGRDVLKNEKRALYDEYLAKQKALLEEYQQKDEWKDDRGFDFYNREMYTQSGGKEYTDYFTHKDRKECEENVFRSFL